MKRIYAKFRIDRLERMIAYYQFIGDLYAASVLEVMAQDFKIPINKMNIETLKIEYQNSKDQK